jgi:hypothetical protein
VTVADALEAEAVAGGSECRAESLRAIADESRERVFDRPHTHNSESAPADRTVLPRRAARIAVGFASGGPSGSGGRELFLEFLVLTLKRHQLLIRVLS